MTAQASVLVVGGAGYIGSHTCKALHARGLRPVVFDNLSTGHASFVRWGPLVEGDILDPARVEQACREHGISAAIHFAACAYVGESVTDPAKYYRNNVSGSLSLLEGLRRAGVGDIVFSSTCAVYGEPAQVPISEATPTSPINPYGASKLMVERILADYAAAYGLRWAALRYFNASGADPDGELGELRDPETHLIPRAIMALQGYIDDFQVFGDDYPTPDGTAVRDYIHVADLAEAHCAALDLLARPPFLNRAINLGTGSGHSVREILQGIETIAGASLPSARGARRPGDPAVLVADVRLAAELLGVTPRHSDLETILRTAWNWHRHAHPKRN